ncbi:MAG: hypothetical protein AB7V46_06170 [Thermomicrobiales bacterium]
MSTLNRGAAAQDATPDAAGHPIIGTWSVEFQPAQPARLSVLISFHADGSMVWSHPFGGIGIGVWIATGERTVDSMTKHQNISATPGEFIPGTVTSWSTFTVEEDDSLTERGVVEVQTTDGTVVAVFPHEPDNRFMRLTVEPRPTLDLPEATPTS